MKVLAIDPGTTESAFVLLDAGRVLQHGKLPNPDLLDRIERGAGGAWDDAYCAIEMVASYGMPVGAEVFETCVWIGRFVQARAERRLRVHRNEVAHHIALGITKLVLRRVVKLHLCGQARAKDSNIRTALLDRFGPGKEKAVGTKKAPGPLFGIKADVWQALALAVTFADGAAA